MAVTSAATSLTPCLVVPDAEAELAFLREAFGAVERNADRGRDGRLRHADLSIGPTVVMLCQAGPRWPAGAATFHLEVSDVDGVYRRAVAAGALIHAEPDDGTYGRRTAGVVDPAGLIWWIAAARHQGSAGPPPDPDVATTRPPA